MKDDVKYSLKEALDIVNGLGHLDKKELIQTIVDRLNGDELINRHFEESIDKHVAKIMDSYKDKIWALADWLKLEGYIGLNEIFEYNAGDRKMCYLGNYDDVDVIYFENQNMNMVAVLRESYKKELHIRLVYPKIEDRDDYGWYSLENNYAMNLDEFKKKLKGDDGIAFAICNLTSVYHDNKYADTYIGNKHPYRIDLQTMIDNKFKRGTHGFEYMDSRDNNYVYSDNLSDRCDFSNHISERKYLLEEIISALESDALPNDFYQRYFREQKIKEVID